ncbi:WG repeat-containing protein [Paenibacillus sp. MBLB4367]|uniref:WG repeat-containing protein n=1 Tax=Paenibacillus sp. MBLB4367 TaxID=3384767 RepID=UPI003907FC00
MKKVVSLMMSLALLLGIVPMAYAETAQPFAISPQYDDARSFSEGLAAVQIGGKWGYIDHTGKTVVEPKYKLANNFSEGFASVQLNGKWGFIDKSGQEVIKPAYEGIYGSPMPMAFREGLSTVAVDEKIGFIDKAGSMVIEPKYDLAYGFSEGLAAVLVDGKLGFIDKSGKEVVKPQYEVDEDEYSELQPILFSGGLARVSKGGKWGYIDKTGKEVIALKYEGAYAFSEGMAAIVVEGYVGFIDTTGKEVIPPTYARFYTDDYRFQEGYALVAHDDESLSFIDKEGKPFMSHGYYTAFTEGLAGTYKEEGLGFIDKTGKIVVQPQFENFYTPDTYEEHYRFQEGRAAAYWGEKWGYLASPLASSETAKPGAVESGTKSAAPTASKVVVDGKEVAFEAYHIDGNNFFKLRDLAMAVNGTGKQFEVGWDNAKNAINLESGKAYTAAGGELTVSGQASAKEAKPTSSKLFIDGKEAQLTAYNIDGNNYFKLRDIAKAINFGVTWDGSKNQIGIDSKLSYTE